MKEMSETISALVAWILKASGVLLLANEVRGILLAGPVLYAMYESGGTLMAIWVGFCCLAGIALSVIVPIVIAKKACAAFGRARAA
jgi:hypothetical protein